MNFVRELLDDNSVFKNLVLGFNDKNRLTMPLIKYQVNHISFYCTYAKKVLTDNIVRDVTNTYIMESFLK